VTGSVEEFDPSENNPIGDVDEPEDEDCACGRSWLTNCGTDIKGRLLVVESMDKDQDEQQEEIANPP